MNLFLPVLLSAGTFVEDPIEHATIALSAMRMIDFTPSSEHLWRRRRDNLPGLRGRVPLGVGMGAGLSPVSWGEKGGSDTTTPTVNTLVPHNHSIP